MRISDILAATEALAGQPLRGDEGIQIGPSDREVSRVLVCWMGTRDALLAAERLGAELVITHESLFYPYNARIVAGEPQPWEDWPTNRRRREIIERSGMTVVRIHGSADRICIYDVFAAQLQLGGTASGEGYNKTYEIPPVAFKDLVAHVKRRMNLARVRISCSDEGWEQKVHRVGLPWGGMGLYTNVGYQAWALQNGCDVLIAGESDSYGFRFSGECGVPMIETSHEASETPGMRRFAAILAERRPGASFDFHDNGAAWRSV